MQNPECLWRYLRTITRYFDSECNRKYHIRKMHTVFRHFLLKRPDYGPYPYNSHVWCKLTIGSCKKFRIKEPSWINFSPKKVLVISRYVTCLSQWNCGELAKDVLNLFGNRKVKCWGISWRLERLERLQNKLHGGLKVLAQVTSCIKFNLSQCSVLVWVKESRESTYINLQTSQVTNWCKIYSAANIFWW